MTRAATPRGMAGRARAGSELADWSGLDRFVDDFVAASRVASSAAHATTIQARGELAAARR